MGIQTFHTHFLSYAVGEERCTLEETIVAFWMEGRLHGFEVAKDVLIGEYY